MKTDSFIEKQKYCYSRNRFLFVLIFILGLIIRLGNYFNDPGLWYDEARLALNLIDRSYLKLLLPLDDFQVAPILFLWIEKLNIGFFGASELVLRLFPLLCSIFSLPAFYLLAKNLFKDEKTALTSLVIFAITPIQIRYSAEVKQYMTDVLVSLILFWLFSVFLKHGNRKLLIMLAFAGVISIFLSNISVMVLFTLCVYWFTSDIFFKKKDHAKYIVMSIWMFTFCVYYYLFINNHMNEQYMLDYWQNNFLPLNPFHAEFWNFFNSRVRETFSEFMIYNQGILVDKFDIVIINLFLIIYFAGLIFMVGRRKIAMIFFMIFPILLHLLLSGFKKYPFEARLALYLSPLVIMTFSYGLVQLYKLSEKILKSKWPGIILMILILSVFSYKLYINYPIENDGIRESIKFINENYRENQKVYIYYFSKPAFEYYKKTMKSNFSDVEVIGVGKGNVVSPETGLDNLKGINGEVWLLFSHLFKRDTPDNPENIIMNGLIKRGLLMNSFQTKDSSAYLVMLQ